MHVSGPAQTILGEVRTSLLPESAALSRGSAAELVALAHGKPVRSRERPVSWAQSPVIAEGIDCRLATSSRKAPRMVGAVAARATVTGGRVLQSTAQCSVVGAPVDRRQSWEYYMARVGVAEVVTRLTPDLDNDVALNFLAPANPEVETFDPGAIAARVTTRVRRNPMLDQRPPLQTESTRLRWSARVVAGSDPSLTMTLCDNQLRTAAVVVGHTDLLSGVADFCEDLARHDWLLTVLTEVMDEAEISEFSPAPVDQVISPMLEHLVRLWMPGKATPRPLRDLWTALQDDPGFDQQWKAQVDHLRDRLSVAMVIALKPSHRSW